MVRSLLAPSHLLNRSSHVPSLDTLQRCTKAVCVRRRDALRAGGIEVADAAQEIRQVILTSDSYDPARAAYSTYVTSIAQRQVNGLLRRANRACRHLPSRMRASDREADSISEADPERPSVLTGKTIIQLASHLMYVARNMARKPGDNSKYSPCTRAAVSILSGKLSMGYRAMARLLREDRRLQDLLCCRPVPPDRVLRHWLEDNATAVYRDAVKASLRI